MTRTEIRNYIESKLIPPFKPVMGNGLATPSGIYFWDDNFDAVAVLIGRYDNGNVTCLSVSSIEQLKRSAVIRPRTLGTHGVRTPPANRSGSYRSRV